MADQKRILKAAYDHLFLNGFHHPASGYRLLCSPFRCLEAVLIFLPGFARLQSAWPALPSVSIFYVNMLPSGALSTPISLALGPTARILKQLLKLRASSGSVRGGISSSIFQRAGSLRAGSRRFAALRSVLKTPSGMPLNAFGVHDLRLQAPCPRLFRSGSVLSGNFKNASQCFVNKKR